MLHQANNPQPRDRPDPVASVLATILTLVATALLVAAILAVYTYQTPQIEGPLVATIAAVFVATLAFAIVVLLVRHARSSARQGGRS